MSIFFYLHLIVTEGKAMREIGTPGGRYVHVNHRLQIARKNKKRLKFSFSKLGSAAYGFLRRPIIQNVLTVV